MWETAPTRAEATTTEVHIWCAALDITARQHEALLCTLSPDEQLRAASFHVPDHRRRFVAARGLLRATLARYLGIPAAGVRFRYNAFGKPELVRPYPNGTLQFNLTHSDGLMLLAITEDAPIGIDLEQIRSLPDLVPLSAHAFTRTECDALGTLSGTDRLAAFFRCWTRKEAFIKANGHGLSFPLQHVSVSVLPGEPVRLHWIRDDAATNWHLEEVPVGAGWVAAVAMRSAARQLRCWRM